MKKLLLSLALALGLSAAVNAQGNVGIGTTTPNTAAGLDITATNMGFLAPRLPLNGATIWTLIGTPTDGMIVFNTATVTGGQAITPGYYFWMNNKWNGMNAIAAAPSVAVDCANSAINGTYSNGIPLTAANTVTIIVQNNSFSAATVSGATTDLVLSGPAAAGITVASVSPASVSPAAGGGTATFTYTLSGTPTTAGSFTATWTKLSLSCAKTGTVGATPPATISATASCTVASAGTLQVGVPVTGVTQTINVNPSTIGTYSITATANGVTFAASGTFTTTGARNVVLTATGTPTTGGVNAFAISGAPACSFNRTVTPAATYACSSAVQVQSPVGSLTNGASYTGSYTIPYTAGNGTSYATSTQTINGLTLTRVAGTYSAGGGNVVYNLTGTYTGPTNDIVTFTIPECTTAIFGDAIRGTIASVGCASCTAYDAATVGTFVKVTGAEYDAVNNATNITGVTTGGATNTTMSPMNNAVGLTANGYTVGNVPSPGYSTTVNANSYIIGFTFKGAFGTPNGSQVNLSTAAYSGTNTTVGTIVDPSTTTSTIVQYYYVVKRPSATTPGSPTHLIVYEPSQNSIGYYNPGVTIGDYTNIAGNGSPNTGSSNGHYQTQIQVLTTTTKQW